MKNITSILFLFLLAYNHGALAQSKGINRKDFFKDESPLEISLSTDMKNLLSEKKNPVFQPATVLYRLPDSTVINEEIRVRRRGQFRNNQCYLASMMIDFKNPTSPTLSPLKKIKWVGGCTRSSNDNQLVFREYLIYKIYNLLTEMSFRVRLLKTNFTDSKNKVRPYSQYSFLIENVNDMAKRNSCVEKKGIRFHTEHTNRDQMTLVAIFQYMIGNYDWSVPFYHNMKLIVPENDTLTRPYPVPYDFDYTGLVNAPYAIPPEELGTRHITERVYRGFPRNLEEIETAAAIFNQQHEQIISMVKNFDLLTARNKRQVVDYLEDFYQIIRDKKDIKRKFIEGARTD